VVTGAGRGIGKAIALKFADEGAKVVINDVSASHGKSVAERLKKAGKEAFDIHADVSQQVQVKLMFERIIQRFGRVDILVANAGVKRDVPIHRMSEEDWNTVINTNLKGSFNCAQAAQKHMVRQGYGRIIIIASPIPGGLGAQGQINYSTASDGLVGLTKALAIELGKYNITVNCIAPDFIDTEMTRSSARRLGLYLEDFKKAATALIPLKRLGTPEDVANVALFLASDESSFVSGQTIYVRGGP